jgi:hypothetical protein
MILFFCILQRIMLTEVACTSKTKIVSLTLYRLIHCHIFVISSRKLKNYEVDMAISNMAFILNLFKMC